MRQLIRSIVFPGVFGLILWITAAPAGALDSYDRYDFRPADPPGASDFPKLGRIPGAVLDVSRHAAFETLGLPGGERRVEAAGEVSGETWFLHYRLPPDVSPSAAAATYRSNLEALGLDIVWTCRRLSLTNLNRLARLVDGHRNAWTRGNPPRDVYCVVARGTLDARPTTVQVYTYSVPYTGAERGRHPAARLYVVQDKPLDTTLEVVTAEEMARAIDSDGRVALYGITFDHDSDRIRPESAETLDQIARMMAEQAQLELYVVGHTDATGAFDYNMDLSRRRAASVVAALVERGVARARLAPHGVGPLAPVANNASDQGRAKNRRVELVRR